MLERLEPFIGQELTDDVRKQIEAIWDGYVLEENPDTFVVQDHDESRLNIYVDADRRITSFKAG